MSNQKIIDDPLNIKKELEEELNLIEKVLDTELAALKLARESLFGNPKDGLGPLDDKISTKTCSLEGEQNPCEGDASLLAIVKIEPVSNCEDNNRTVNDQMSKQSPTKDKIILQNNSPGLCSPKSAGPDQSLTQIASMQTQTEPSIPMVASPTRRRKICQVALNKCSSFDKPHNKEGDTNHECIPNGLSQDDCSLEVKPDPFFLSSVKVEEVFNCEDSNRAVNDKDILQNTSPGLRSGRSADPEQSLPQSSSIQTREESSSPNSSVASPTRCKRVCQVLLEKCDIYDELHQNKDGPNHESSNLRSEFPCRSQENIPIDETCSPSGRKALPSTLSTTGKDSQEDIDSQDTSVPSSRMTRNSTVNLWTETAITPCRKRQRRTSGSESSPSTPLDEQTSQKRVHFADGGSIKTLHVFKKSVKPKVRYPDGRSPSASILKNKHFENVIKTSRKNKSRNSKKLHSSSSTGNVTTGRTVENNQTDSGSDLLTDWLPKSFSSRKSSQKKYNFNCPILQFFCVCGNWCKREELEQHVAACRMFQPQVSLTRLQL